MAFAFASLCALVCLVSQPGNYKNEHIPASEQLFNDLLWFCSLIDHSLLRVFNLKPGPTFISTCQPACWATRRMIMSKRPPASREMKPMGPKQSLWALKLPTLDWTETARCRCRFWHQQVHLHASLPPRGQVVSLPSIDQEKAMFRVRSLPCAACWCPSRTWGVSDPPTLGCLHGSACCNNQSANPIHLSKSVDL